MADAIETHSRALALLQTTTIATLDDMRLPVTIWSTPVEIPARARSESARDRD